MDTARRLLDAHTQFELEQLRGGDLGSLLEAEVDHILATASRLTLEQAVDRAEITAVAIKYVAAFRLPGAIPELAGDIALRVRNDPANGVLVSQVVPRRHVAAAVGKVSEMQVVRERLAAQLAENPSVHQWLTDFIHGLTTEAVASNRRLAEKIPGVRFGLSVGDRVAGGAVREADKLGRAGAERAAKGILHRWRDAMARPAEDDLVEALLDVWDDMSDRTLISVLDSIEDDDLVDIVVLVYDLWLELRENPYLHSLIGTGVDYFFDTYGDFTLDALLTEFGLGRADLVEEAMRFGPRAIRALDEAGELEGIVRRRLAAFYESPAARAALGSA